MNRTFKPGRQKNQILITWKLLSRSRRNFYRDYAPRIRFRGSPNKSKMAAAAIFNFGKMLITPDRIKIYGPNFMGRCIAAMRRWPRDQKSNRKLIRVTSWNEGLKDKWVDLSDNNRYLNQIWYRAQIPHYQHAGMPNSHNLTIQDGGAAILISEKMSITPDWIKISASNFTV